MILLVTKKELSKILSNLKGFDNPEISLEQYITPSEIASNFLWLVYMQRDIKGKIIADLGSGTGILGIGALILGAEKVYFVDQSLEALEIAKKNLSSVRIDKNRASFICKNVSLYSSSFSYFFLRQTRNLLTIKKKKPNRRHLSKIFELRKNKRSVKKH